MCSMTVYKVLLEVFPQVDCRVLKAVAVEHRKDSDIAVLAVLNEIIPFLEDNSRPSNPSDDSDEQQKGTYASLPDESDPRYDDYHAEEDGGLASGGTVTSEIQENNIVGVLGQSSDAVDGMIHAYNAPDADIGRSDESLGRDLSIGGYKVLNEEKLRAQDKMASPGSCNELVVEHNLLTVAPKIHESDCSLNGDSEKHTAAAIYDSSSCSSKISSVELLEGIIDDAKSNKKMLSSALESVINLMGDLALKEVTVEPAKLEASVAGRNLVTALEDLQKRSQLMKDANYILAGELYEDRAVLATEMKELHLRLQSLSEEKKRSLKILEEMHGTLLSRLAAIETEEKAAEEERLEKEELGRRSLAEQELIMDSLVQESKLLNQQVEENDKLRGFLGKRSQVIDMLQGEFSVISQDVRLLKEKFDQSFPFSSSTSCILASLRSSLKSVTTDHASEVHGDQFGDSFEQLQELDVIPATTEQQFSVEQLAVDDKKVMATDQASEAPPTIPTHQFEESFEHLQELDVIPATTVQQFPVEQLEVDDKKITATDQTSKSPPTSPTHQFEESFEHLQELDAIPATTEQQVSVEQLAADDKKEALEDGWETI